MDLTQEHIEDLQENSLFLNRMLILISYIHDERFRVDNFIEITKEMKEDDIDYEEIFVRKKNAIENRLHKKTEGLKMNDDRRLDLKKTFLEKVDEGEFYEVVEKLTKIVYEELPDSRVIPPINGVTTMLMDIRREEKIDKIKERLYKVIRDVFGQWKGELDRQGQFLEIDKERFYNDVEIVKQEFSITKKTS